MSTRRLVATAAGMTAIAVGLERLTPALPSLVGTLADAQRTADTLGPDAVVLAAAALAAWAVWSWGALGLTLTAASALPGLAGAGARAVLHVVLPAGARRGAALALGLGLGVAGPLAGPADQEAPVAAAGLQTLPTAAGPGPDSALEPPVPDWPEPAPHAGPAPDRPAAPESHVVVRGDCLWNIAGDRLRDRHARTPTDGEVAVATAAWWRANSAVIGPDPDLLLPGQVLSPPEPP